MRRLAESLKPYGAHPVVQAAAQRDAALRARAAEETACVEASLARVRRVAGVEPAPVFVRTVASVVREVRVLSGRYPSAGVAAWRAAVLRELGAALFQHAAEVMEIEVHIERDLSLARRGGRA